MSATTAYKQQYNFRFSFVEVPSSVAFVTKCNWLCKNYILICKLSPSYHEKWPENVISFKSTTSDKLKNDEREEVFENSIVGLGTVADEKPVSF